MSISKVRGMVIAFWFGALLAAPDAVWASAHRLSTQSSSGFGFDSAFKNWLLSTGVDLTSGITVSEMTTCPGFDGSQNPSTTTCPDGHYRFLFQFLSAPDDVTITFSGITVLSNPTESPTSTNLIVFETCSAG